MSGIPRRRTIARQSPEQLEATRYARQVAETLREHAQRHLDAAARSESIEDADTRERNAAQLRFVASVTLGGQIALGETWISASSRMLAAYDATDMEAVHASRSSRRTAPDA